MKKAADTTPFTEKAFQDYESAKGKYDQALANAKNDNTGLKSLEQQYQQAQNNLTNAINAQKYYKTANTDTQKILQTIKPSDESIPTQYKTYADSPDSVIKNDYNKLDSAAKQISAEKEKLNKALENLQNTAQANPVDETAYNEAKQAYETLKNNAQSTIDGLQKDYSNDLKNLKTTIENSSHGAIVNNIPFDLGNKSFAPNQTINSLENSADNINKLQDIIAKGNTVYSDDSHTLAYKDTAKIMKDLNKVSKDMKTLNQAFANSSVNASKIQQDISNTSSSLDDLEQEIKSMMGDSTTTAQEKTNLEQALKVIKHAQSVIAQTKSNVQQVAVSVGIVPRHSVSITDTQSVTGSAYGVDVQIGYKYFFGKTKHWGIRGYATYAYMQSNLGHTTNMQGAGLGVGQANNHTYGAGFDFLYNFHESQDGVHTAGILLGTELLGSTW
ncbi:outer membrane beta-barrel protein, partial [Helicobacter cetorum]|uniref:outer membrane beta-barrel protein n=1 Tax=Helicobacter cetorum TaxID=138563 RepID=UPI00131569DA